jgi:hypothetical protein
MMLPGRLRTTTLGDLLGALHRSHASGVLELTEEAQERVHRVYLSRGLLTWVEVDRASPSLAELLRDQGSIDDELLRRSLLRALAGNRLHGEVLRTEFHVPSADIARALRTQLRLRLGLLDRLADARIAFHVSERPPRSALTDGPLSEVEFLHGRRRARDRKGRGGTRERQVGPSRAAYAVLGLRDGASVTEVKRAYRDAVRRYHPDLHPSVSDTERKAMQVAFAQMTDAYRAITERS